MRVLVASLLLAAGCPICPDGSIELVSGRRDGTVHAGDVIQLRARYGDDVISGPGDCRGFWYVNQLEGGSAALGTIDRCGLYRAPAALPADTTLHIEATDWDLRTGCADCCPYADRVLTPAP